MSCAQDDNGGLHTNPKRERGESRRLSPRSRFGLVWPVRDPSVNRCNRATRTSPSRPAVLIRADLAHFRICRDSDKSHPD